MVRYANLAPCACERQTIHEIEHAARAAGGLLGETIPIICSCSQNEGRHAGTSARKVCEGPRLPCRALAAVTAPRYVRASRTTGTAAD